MRDETMDAIDTVMRVIMAGWKAGDGQEMSRPFAERARFVTFDGRVLSGPKEIAAFHQEAFDTHLKSTVLQLKISEVRALADGVWAVFTTGGIGKDGGADVELVGDSIQTFVCRKQGESVMVEAFQNTRERPIADRASAEVWHDFDDRWNKRNG